MQCKRIYSSYLFQSDCNFVLVDWEKGAKPQYTQAAANTQIVGRQLGIFLLHMINKGMKAEDIHLIGFSLGAHVAGCASEFLKTRGYLIGRITGTFRPSSKVGRHVRTMNDVSIEAVVQEFFNSRFGCS